MRRGAVVVVAAVLVLVTAACSSDGDDASSTSPRGGKGTEYRVVVDGRTDTFAAEMPFFFPRALEVHPGDSVKFAMPEASGAPHTATLGTLVDRAVAKLGQLGPTASFEAQENLPEMSKLPGVFPHKYPPAAADVNHSAAEPCFLATGEPSASLGGGAAGCARVPAPAFDGTQTFYNSGILLEDGDAFTMKVSPQIRLGTYNIICLVHRGAMLGQLTVLPDTAPLPAPAEVEATGKAEFDEVVGRMSAAAAAAARGGAGKPLLGVGVEDGGRESRSVVAEFGPESLSVAAGSPVTWQVAGTHTLTFGASDTDIGALVADAEGAIHLSPKLGATGFNSAPGIADFPPAEKSQPVTVDLGAFDGSGFKSSGIVVSEPPRLVFLQVTFTRAGTYPVRCLIHPLMTGEVRVG